LDDAVRPLFWTMRCRLVAVDRALRPSLTVPATTALMSPETWTPPLS
jgi:hypothetical protein